VKNLFIFTWLFFSRSLFDPERLLAVGIGFLLFCLAASGIYLFNDIHDSKKDRTHPEKRSRPLAAGLLAVPIAFVVSAGFAAAALVGAFLLDRLFFLIILGYLALNVAYTLKAKEIVIIDVMIISAGFVLRVLAGTVLAHVEPSSWLVLSTIMISLFLGFVKRRNELLVNGGKADNQRSVLIKYTIPFLDQMISVATAGTAITYTLYTVAEETATRFGTKKLIYTIPFVLYGIFRYLFIGYSKQMGENPTRVLLGDWPLLVNCALWATTVFFLIYFQH
jgi:4-hydroxybenzoate polyprenyltransferase